MTSDNPAMLTTEFWEEIKNGKLVRPVCQDCDISFFSPQTLCPQCQSDNWKFRESSGKGSIYSFTIVHRPPDNAYPTPYIIIDVELEEKWRMYSRLLIVLPLCAAWAPRATRSTRKCSANFQAPAWWSLSCLDSHYSNVQIQV